jgi:hypothetical protein
VAHNIDYDKLNRELYERFKIGDELALKDLINLNRGLAISRANIFYKAASLEYRPSIGLEDLEQIALIGVWQGILKWDPERGNLSKMIVWSISNEMRAVFKTGLSVSLNEPVPGGEDRDTEKQDLIPDLDAIDPALECYSSVRCREYFDFMADHADPIELQKLKRYVYGIDERPKKREIQSCQLFFSRDPAVQAFKEKFLERRIDYYRSSGFADATHKDPTAFAAIKRIELINSLEVTIKKNLEMYEGQSLSFLLEQLQKYQAMQQTCIQSDMIGEAKLIGRVVEDLQNKIDEMK